MSAPNICLKDVLIPTDNGSGNLNNPIFSDKEVDVLSLSNYVNRNELVSWLKKILKHLLLLV